MAELQGLDLLLRRSKRLRSRNPALAETSYSSSSSSSFMSDANDDLLMEILLRLPDAPFVAQSGLVCKRWSSLIFSNEFRTRFNQNHRHHHSRYLDPSYSLPYTLLFRFFLDITFTSHVPSSNARPGKIYHYPESAGYLDFLPKEWYRSRIKISSGDLVLSSFDERPMKYCVSNPLTRQWNILPEVPPELTYRCTSGLWLDPNHYGSNRRLGNYKVVFLNRVNAFVVAGDNYMFRALMFCSETGKWSERNFTARRPSGLAAGSVVKAIWSKGVLYFPLTSGLELKGFLALDPVGSSVCRVLNLPDGLGDAWRTQLKFRVGFGVVRGRLRLWQLLKNNGGIDLKVWELRDDDDDDDETTWVLVHDVSVKRDKRKAISLAAFDPNDGDVVFMVLNSSICKYNIRGNKYEKVGQLPDIKRRNLQWSENILWSYLTVYTIVHNSWRVLPM